MEITLNVTLLTALVALLLTGGVFLVAVLAFLLKGVSAMLKSTENNFNTKVELLKDNQTRMESEIKEVKIKLDKLLAR